MAKPTQKASKTPKKRSTKYSKLAAVCSKELAVKKTALVRAEKALAKAQKNHSDLLGDVARLDMLDRSLKALIDGTEPPQNVKYVYTYPQWVWQPTYQNWYPYNGSHTITLGNVQTSAFQGGFTTSNLTGLTGSNSVVTTNAVNNAFTTNASAPSWNSSITVPSGGLVLNNSGGSWDNTDTTKYTLSTFQNTPTFTSGTADLTVDLSTGATQEEPNDEEEKAAEVGHGG